MALEHLMNKSMVERELYEKICLNLQIHFDRYLGTYLFIQLKQDINNNSFSYISEIKDFKNPNEFMNYFYDTEYERACALVKFEFGKYTLLGMGFWLCKSYTISTNEIQSRRDIILSGRRGYAPMIPREVLENGFGEIESKFQK